jgi:ferrous iron transport protein A
VALELTLFSMRPMISVRKTILIAAIMTLYDLSPLTPARIISSQLSAELTQRLAALGLHADREIEVIRRGCLGGPLQLRCGSTEFMLRRDAARQIVVALLPEANSLLSEHGVLA